MPSKARSLSKAVSQNNPLATGVINASDVSGLAAATRSALSFVEGTGNYNSTTGLFTLPTGTSHLTNNTGYITGNQNITISGDVTGSGATAINLTLANSGVTAGTYGSSTNIPQVIVNAKGLVTSVSNVAVSIPSGSLTFTGDVTGSGTTGSSTTLTLANSGVTAGTYTKLTVDSKGRVTTGTSLASSDLPTYTGTITSSQVTTALGFTPYSNTNPSGYITSSSLSSYSPSLTGTGASGTWGISITGSASSATSATTATNWGTYGGVPGAGTSFGNANTIGRSDGNGYTFFFYINSNTANSENPGISQVIVTNGSDNYYRKASISHLTGAVQSNASGTWSINVTGNAGTASTAGALTTGNNYQMNSLGVGTSAGNGGEIRATSNITAYYSDDKLKTKLGVIENALDKLCSLTGFYYEANEVAQSLGYIPVREVGLSAQETQRVLPEVVVPAPIDDKYLTIRYEKVIPLIVEAIKELRTELVNLKQAEY